MASLHCGDEALMDIPIYGGCVGGVTEVSVTWDIVILRNYVES